MGCNKKIKIGFRFQALRFKLKGLVFFLGVCFAFLFGVSLALPLVAQASRLYFEPSQINVSPGSVAAISVLLDTENEDINAIEGFINFPLDIFNIQSLNEGNSIINFWLVKPETQDQKIVFAGIIPGGYKGENGSILTFSLEAKKEGEGKIKFDDKTRVLLNDGKGTEAPLTISNFQFLISKQIPISQIPKSEIKDVKSPESFVPEIARDSSIFDGKYFLVFATQDKNSGIDYYEVSEKRTFKILGIFEVKRDEWEKSESPHLLKDQELKSIVKVRAIDRAGNQRIESISPKYEFWYNKIYIQIIFILLLSVMLTAFIRRIFKSKRTEK